MSNLSERVFNCFHPARVISVIAVVCILLSACGQKSATVMGHPLGYDLEHPKILTLPAVLNEISGLSYYSKDSSLFAIVDEQGYLYKIFPYHSETMMRWKFAGHGDFEDVVKIDSSFYVLKSDGTIFQVVVRGTDQIFVKENHFRDEGNEFESLYWDDSTRSLVMVCKDCKQDKKKSVSTYQFNIATDTFQDGVFAVDAKDVAVMLGLDKMKLKPSAVAINPVSHKLFILSSVNKLLIVANRDGTAEAAYGLNPKLYKQPEGIAFAPDGTLFISNEKGTLGAGTILTIPYQPNKSQK